MAARDVELTVAILERASPLPLFEGAATARGPHRSAGSELARQVVESFCEPEAEHEPLAERRLTVERFRHSDELAFALEVDGRGPPRPAEVALGGRGIAIAQAPAAVGKRAPGAGAEPQVGFAAPVPQVVLRLRARLRVVAYLVVNEAARFESAFDRRERVRDRVVGQ